jgi:KTSC domain
MRRVPVDSDALASVGYDASKSVLEIEFTSGGVYRYYGVPAAAHRRLMDAESHGRHFAAHVRDRYRYRKAEPGSARLEE